MESLSRDFDGEAFDKYIFPNIVKNNSQYRKRFHIDNYSDIRIAYSRGDYTKLPEYQFLNDSKFDQKKENLNQLENFVANDSTLQPVVRKLYLDKIAEKKKLLDLVRCASNARQNSKIGWDSSLEFVKLNEELFGLPESSIFNQLLQVIESDLCSLPTKVHESVQFKSIAKIFSGRNDSSVQSYNAFPVACMPMEGPFLVEAEDVVSFFYKEMSAAGINNWQVVVSEKSIDSFRVSITKKTVFVPKSSVLKSRRGNRRLTPNVLRGLFNHEILTHVVRAINGSQSKLQLLSVGLAGYLKGEEGIATYREQQCSVHNDYSGGTMYFAIALAYGLDQGGQKRNFNEVYEILSNYFWLKYEGLEKFAKRKAFATCARIFVLGHPDNQPLVLTHDILYRKGNIEINNLLKNKPEYNTKLDLGKYDPNNDNHVEALTSLGILTF